MKRTSFSSGDSSSATVRSEFPRQASIDLCGDHLGSRRARAGFTRTVNGIRISVQKANDTARPIARDENNGTTTRLEREAS